MITKRVRGNKYKGEDVDGTLAFLGFDFLNDGSVAFNSFSIKKRLSKGSLLALFIYLFISLNYKCEY